MVVNDTWIFIRINNGFVLNPIRISHSNSHTHSHTKTTRAFMVYKSLRQQHLPSIRSRNGTSLISWLCLRYYLLSHNNLYLHRNLYILRDRLTTNRNIIKHHSKRYFNPYLRYTIHKSKKRLKLFN